jgi:hypothetical protein
VGSGAAIARKCWVGCKYLWNSRSALEYVVRLGLVEPAWGHSADLAFADVTRGQELCIADVTRVTNPRILSSMNTRCLALSMTSGDAASYVPVATRKPNLFCSKKDGVCLLKCGLSVRKANQQPTQKVEAWRSGSHQKRLEVNVPIL